MLVILVKLLNMFHLLIEIFNISDGYDRYKIDSIV